jgi:hypothetical protein
MTSPPLTLDRAQARRSLRQQRDAAVARRFTELYEQQRLRFDDVVARLAAEFFVRPRTITQILKRPHSTPS